MIASLYNFCLMKKKKTYYEWVTFPICPYFYTYGVTSHMFPTLCQFTLWFTLQTNDYVAIIDLRNDSTSSTTSFKMYNVMLN